MANKYGERVKQYTDTVGTGTLNLTAVVVGYQTFATAGLVDGDTVPYLIEEGPAWEIGVGTLTGTTLTRSVIASSTGTAIALSGSTAMVSLVLTAADFTELTNRVFAHERDILRLAMSVSELRASGQYQTANGFSDDFDSADSVTAVAATLSSSAYHSSYAASGTMTSATTSTDSSTIYFSTSPTNAYQMWDLNDATEWADATALPHQNWRQWSTAKTWKYMRVKCGADPTKAPKTFALLGTTDNVNYTNEIQITNAPDWTANEARVYKLTTQFAAAYHGLYVSAIQNGGNSGTVAEVTLYADAMTLTSPTAVTAASVPSRASLLVAAKANASFVLNTDLTAYVSRDNGVTFQKVTLVAREVVGTSYTVYEAVGVDISAQPSGTAMKWQVVGLPPIAWDVFAVTMLWN